MIKALLSDPNVPRRHTLLLGLSDENISRMRHNMPVRVDLVEFCALAGISPADIKDIGIYTGEPGCTEIELQRILHREVAKANAEPTQP